MPYDPKHANLPILAETARIGELGLLVMTNDVRAALRGAADALLEHLDDADELAAQTVQPLFADTQ